MYVYGEIVEKMVSFSYIDHDFSLLLLFLAI